ncbi:MAG: hypothetical protein JSS35_10315, partial [Proteobacteria bacterium]|nr:hypothetical protein [Pseudomonadota bacterium]
MRRGPSPFNRLSVGLGLVFLYAPIALLVLYSFNASRLVTVWGGWSMRWYSALLDDQAMLDAVAVSLRVGVISASAATALGLLAAVSLARGGWSGARCHAAATAGAITGSVAFRKAVAGGQPRSRAASSRPGSTVARRAR